MTENLSKQSAGSFKEIKDKVLKKGDKFIIVLTSTILALTGLALPMSILIIFDRVLPNSSYSTLYFLLFALFVIAAFELLLKTLQKSIISVAENHFELTVHKKMFDSILNANLLRFRKRNEAEYIETFREVGQLKEFYSGQYLVSITNIISSLIIALMIGFMQVYAIIVPLIGIMLLGIIYYVKDARLIPVFIEQRKTEAAGNADVIDVVKGIDTVKAKAMEPRIENKMRNDFKFREQLSYQVTTISAKADNLAQYVTAMTIILQVVVCGSFVIAGDLTQGSLAAIVLLINRLMPPVQQGFAFISRYRKHKIYKDEICDVFNLRDTDKIKDNHFESKFQLDITVHNKTPSEEEFYQLKPSSVTAITGSNGAGKSLLLKSVLGLANSERFSFSISGKKTTEVNTDQWHSSVAYITARSDFLNASLIENLTCFNAELNHIAIAVCDAFGIKSEVNRLDAGFYTPIRNGLRNSVPASLCSHLLIVQAIVNGTHLILLDDLADFSEKEAESLLDVIRGFSSKSIFMIATHSQTIIKSADNVIKLEGE